MATKPTREHLIDVGLGLMHQNGYNATGLTEILEAAEVPKGSFYHHFDNKEDYAVAVLERYALRQRERTAAILSDTSIPPLPRLQRYFSSLTRLYGQKGPIPGCLMARFSLEVAAQSPQLRNRIRASFKHWQSTIASVIREAVAQKQLPSDTVPESLAGFLLNSWEGALLRSQAENSNAPLETFMRYAFQELLTKPSHRGTAAIR